jgi:hypothetical protein
VILRTERTLSPSVISFFFFLEFGCVCVCVRRGGRVKSRRMYDDDAPDDLMIVSNTDGQGAHTYNQKKKKEGNGREDMVVKLLSNSIDSSSFFPLLVRRGGMKEQDYQPRNYKQRE